MKIGEFTKSIDVNNGYIVLKIDDIKKIETNVDVKKELKKMENYQRNKQLNQWSNIYFSKIKQNTTINEI